MNVTKCINGHFFDQDKYQLCPHCGAIPIVDVSSKPEEESKESHIPFLSKKKTRKEKNVDIVNVPDVTIGKTVGAFGKDMDINLDINLCDKPNVKKEMNLPESLEENYGFLSSNFASNPQESFVFNEKSAREAKVSNKTEIHVEDEKYNSLQDELKKVTYGNTGKTVGFFSSGSDDDFSVEPVVGWLVCVKGKHFGESFVIVAGRNSIGRGESNKINLSRDESVSRSKHAWLTYEPKKREFYIQPGEGSGLSYLNGDNIMESKKLKQNDTLEFGNGQYLLIPLCGESFTWEDYSNKEAE